MAGFPNPTAGNDASQDRASIVNQGHDDVIPGVAVGANAGTGATASMQPQATDLKGQISVVAGTTPSAGVIASITFAKAYEKGTTVLLTKAGASVDALNYSVGNSGATGFSIFANGAISGTVNINYLVLP